MSTEPTGEELVDKILGSPKKPASAMTDKELLDAMSARLRPLPQSPAEIAKRREDRWSAVAAACRRSPSWRRTLSTRSPRDASLPT
jgi:hypothetical protein